MSYVQQVLQPGEVIRHQTKLHWILYAPGLAFLVIALATWTITAKMVGGWAFAANVFALLLLAGAAVTLFMEWFRQWTTEIAITDRRIIFKHGFIRRSTIEMHLDKVESVDVEQSILGRILNYGNVTVRGVGIGLEPLNTIADPLAFRNHVTGTPVTPASSPAVP
jgi:uncharacterized membrane protein YdbT with pleckstrin-like domain